MSLEHLLHFKQYIECPDQVSLLRVQSTTDSLDAAHDDSQVLPFFNRQLCGNVIGHCISEQLEQ